MKDFQRVSCVAAESYKHILKNPIHSPFIRWLNHHFPLLSPWCFYLSSGCNHGAVPQFPRKKAPWLSPEAARCQRESWHGTPGNHWRFKKNQRGISAGALWEFLKMVSDCKILYTSQFIVIFSRENDENPDEKNGVPYFQTNPWDQKKLVPKPMVFLHDFSFKHPEKLIRWEEPDAPGTPNSTFQLTCYGESKTNRSMDLEWKIMKPYRNLNVDWNDFQEWSEHIFSDSIIAVNNGGSGPNPMLATCRNRVGIF